MLGDRDAFAVLIDRTYTGLGRLESGCRVPRIGVNRQPIETDMVLADAANDRNRADAQP